jgi:CRP-like cAMP-binding protein
MSSKRVPRLSLPSPQNRTRRKSSSVKVVPRREVPLQDRKHVWDAALDGLQTKATDRSEWQVQAINAVFSEWYSIKRVAPDERKRKELMRGCEFRYHPENSLLFKEGDASDGWYIVYSGEVVLFSSRAANWGDDPEAVRRECNKNTIRALEYPMDPELYRIANSALHTDKEFLPFRVVGHRGDFGSEHLKKDERRSFTAIMSQPGFIIHIDAFVYRMTLEWLEDSELREKTAFLEQIPELEPLKSYPVLYERLAEVVVKKDLPDCRNCAKLWGGWIAIIEGEITRRRTVDFRNVKIPDHMLEIGDVKIVLPSGTIAMQTNSFGPGHLVADPFLSSGLKKPFTVSIAPKSVCYHLEYEDVKNLLPIDMRREIERIIMDDQDDQSLGNIWVEKERQLQWEVYRDKCCKEARKFVKQTRKGTDANAAFRRVKLPKAVKGLQSPRRKYVPVSGRLLTGRVDG